MSDRTAQLVQYSRDPIVAKVKGIACRCFVFDTLHKILQKKIQEYNSRKGTRQHVYVKKFLFHFFGC